MFAWILTYGVHFLQGAPPDVVHGAGNPNGETVIVLREEGVGPYG